MVCIEVLGDASDTLQFDVLTTNKYIEMVNDGQVIRVIIVDDSIRDRTHLRKLLETSEGIIVVGEAVNGIEALDLILKLKPDVILMDLEMPLMDGMTALQHLMIHVPTPTLMFSRLTAEGTARCFDALKHGAVGFFNKDRLQPSPQEEGVVEAIIAQVVCASKVTVNAVEPVFPKIRRSEVEHVLVKTIVFCEECGSKEELTVRENEDQGEAICSTCGECITIEQRNKIRRANCISLLLGGEGSYVNLLNLIPELRQDMNGALIVLIDGVSEHIDCFTEYLDAISTMKIVRIQDGVRIQGGNCYIGSEEEGIYLRPYSADYTLKSSRIAAAEKGRGANTTIESVAQVLKERSAVVFLSGQTKTADHGIRQLLKNKGNCIVLEPERCLHKAMGLNAIRRFGASTVADENVLAEALIRLHLRYRDSIVTA